MIQVSDPRVWDMDGLWMNAGTHSCRGVPFLGIQGFAGRERFVIGSPDVGARLGGALSGQFAVLLSGKMRADKMGMMSSGIPTLGEFWNDIGMSIPWPRVSRIGATRTVRL